LRKPHEYVTDDEVLEGFGVTREELGDGHYVVRQRHRFELVRVPEDEWPSEEPAATRWAREMTLLQEVGAGKGEVVGHALELSTVVAGRQGLDLSWALAQVAKRIQARRSRWARVAPGTVEGR
jgi:predicted alpha/beta hydrolase family esterase